MPALHGTHLALGETQDQLRHPYHMHSFLSLGSPSPRVPLYCVTPTRTQGAHYAASTTYFLAVAHLSPAGELQQTSQG